MTPAVPVLSLARPGRPCLDQLVGALADLRGGDPLAPATVVVPASIPALHVRRALARLGGVAAVDVLTLPQLADRLAGPALAEEGSQPLPPGGWEEAVRVVLAADPGPFAAVAHHPATVARVATALRRLRPATEAERAELASATGDRRRARHLVRLLAAAERATAGHHDRLSAFEAACAAVRSGTDPGPVVWFCPQGTDPAELGLLEALASTGRLRVVAAATGEPASDEPVRHLVERLGGPATWDPPPGPAPTPVHLVLAPDAEAEARIVVQHVVAALESGVAAAGISVVTFGGLAGLGRLADLLDAAHVAWSGPTGRSLAATASGRALLALLGLESEGWSHTGLLTALASAPLRRGPDRPGPLPLARWAALARKANVVGGADQWEARPRAAAADARRRGDEARAAELDDLAAFSADLRSLLSPPEAGTWTSLSSWALDILDHVLSPEPDSWPDGAVVAHGRVRAAVAGLAALDGAVADDRVGRVGPAALIATLETRLGSTAEPRRGRVGRGVLLATDPLDVLGASPDLLLLAGVVEGAAPSRRTDDPLVSDAELGLIGGAGSRTRRRAAARAAVLHAVAAAGHSVAFASRADAQVARRPSRWFLGWAGDLAGAAAPLGADDLEHHAEPWLTVVPSFTAAACGRVAGSVQERRLSALSNAVAAGGGLAASPVVEGCPPLRRSVAAAIARRSDRFTPWDGLLAPGLALDAEVSASALEDWAACPQRYLLRHVLTVAGTEAPSDALAVDGGDRGTLAHQVLAAVVRRGLGRPPAEPWDDDDRAFLRDELQQRADTLRRRGRLGRGVLADLRIDELQASLLAALDVDDADRAEAGWVPSDVEQGFGERSGRAVAVVLPSSRTIRFTGRIDRVDTNADGRVRVVDYKTGRGKQYLEAAAGGAAAARLLQLGVYEAAARAAHPGTEVSSGWWLVEALTRDGRPLPVQPNHLSANGFSAALEEIASGIESGAFPADPGEDGYRGPDNCRFCPYDRVCRVDRVRALRRKEADPALAPWRALRTVGEDVAADEAGEAQA